MTKYTLQVGGMACSMCEAHVNNAVRKAFPVKKVSSSHTKKQMVILSEQPLTRRPCGAPSAARAIRWGAFPASPMKSGDSSPSENNRSKNEKTVDKPRPLC